jgi:hypothetical protein
MPLGALPFVTVSACMPSFRLADSLVLMATRFSGVSNIVELIDVGAMHTLQDALKSQIQKLLRQPHLTTLLPNRQEGM